MYKHIRSAVISAATLVLFIFAIMPAQAQSPVVAYLIPDIGTPGMNTYMEIIGPYSRNGGFGTDNIYMNNPGDAVQVVCENPSDTDKVRFGPCVVSWNGRMISTQVFVLPTVVATSTDWQTSIRVPIHVIANGAVSNVDTFYIVKPQDLGFNHIFTSGGQFGSGVQTGVNFGLRSRRGAMIVDSVVLLGSGTYSISTVDCDQQFIGNQGYLPFIMMSKGPIRFAPSVVLLANANGVHAGVGGGGGGNGLKCGTLAGDGYTGGGGNANWLNANCGADIPAGIGSGSGAGAFDALPGGGSSSQNEGGGGGSGHPFGLSGSAGGSDNGSSTPTIPGYGGGSGGPQCCSPQQQGGGGGGAYSSNGADGGLWSSHSGGQIVGNNEIVPFAGGSGGGGGNDNHDTATDAGSGGGGGGAIAFFGSSLQASGAVNATGASGTNSATNGAGGGGSGGAVMLGGKLSIGVNASDLIGGNGGSGKPVAMGQDGGHGGSGRARFDGPTVGPKPSITPSATLSRGPSTDTSGYVNKIFTLTGSGNGKDIRIYVRPLSGQWALATTVQNYGTNWSTTITLPATDTVFLLAAAEQVTTAGAAPYRMEPNWVFSQSAANILHSYCAGPSLVLSQTNIDLGSVSVCSEVYDTIIVDNVGCDTAHMTRSLDDLGIGLSIYNAGANVLPNRASDTIILYFKPIALGPISTTLHIKYDNAESILSIVGLGTSGDTALSASPRVLNFDTVSICEEITRRILFTNTGCDSITVRQNNFPTVGDFSVLNSLVGRKMLVGDTASLLVRESGISPGTKLDSIILVVDNAAGIKQSIVVPVLATILPKQRLMTVATIVHIDSLAPCTPFDTVLWIFNHGVCDTLDLSTVTASGFAQLSASANFSIRVVPGDSLGISIHITGSNFMAGTSTVRIQGVGIDTSITIITTQQESGPPFTIRVSDSVLASPYCHVASGTITFRNASCNPVQIDSASLAGSTQFNETPKPNLPIILQPGDSETITITFDPTNSGDSLATFAYRSLVYGLSRQIQLRGTLSTPHINETVSISIDPSSQPLVTVGQKIQMLLQLQDAIPTTVPLNSIQVSLDFNPDLASIGATDIIPLGNFTFLGRTARANGEDISFGYNGPGPITASTPFARLGFDTFVTDTDATPVTVAGIGFNQNDTLFESCVLLPQSGSSLQVGILDFCGRTSLINYLKSGTIATNIVVRPNPIAAENTSFNLDFDLAASSSIEVDVLDVLGAVVHRSYFEEHSAGHKQYRIPIEHLTSGMYVVRLRTPSQVQSVPVMVTR